MVLTVLVLFVVVPIATEALMEVVEDPAVLVGALAAVLG